MIVSSNKLLIGYCLTSVLIYLSKRLKCTLQVVLAPSEDQKWLRKSEQGDKWNRCLIEGMIVLSETGARDEQTTPP